MPGESGQPRVRTRDGRTFELGSVRDRVAAFLIDGLITWVPIVALLVILGLLDGRLDDNSAANHGLWAAWLALFIGLNWVLPACWNSRWGGESPGKRRLGLVVIGEDGQRIGFARGLVRVLWLEAMLLFNLISVVGDSRRQGLHDRRAHTFVVRATPAEATADRRDQRATRHALPATGCPTCGFALAPEGSCRVCGVGARAAS